MLRLYMPDGARRIIDALYENGYEAYIVGGCVRDALLSKAPGDYDITTDASPEDVKRIFKKTVDTGISHGTVTVIEDGIPYEVTTYRIDGKYLDMRHPDSVIYTKNLKDDLCRRDFTVNAMAYNDRVGLVDEFGGIDDLKNKLIRTVGDSITRFSEDALRVLRGIRFSSVLGFDIEENTASAIKELAPRLEYVSAERIYSEWKKLLSGPRAYEVISEYFDVITVFLPELKELSLPKKDAFESLSPTERMISLFVHNGGAYNYLSAMKRLKSDSKTRDMGVCVLNNLLNSTLNSERDMRLYLLRADDEVSLSAAKISEVLGLCNKGTFSLVETLIKSGSPRRVSELKIGGTELLTMGLRGKAVGDALEKLLHLVASGELDNQKDSLVAYASKNFL